MHLVAYFYKKASICLNQRRIGSLSVCAINGMMGVEWHFGWPHFVAAQKVALGMENMVEIGPNSTDACGGSSCFLA